GRARAPGAGRPLGCAGAPARPGGGPDGRPPGGPRRRPRRPGAPQGDRPAGPGSGRRRGRGRGLMTGSSPAEGGPIVGIDLGTTHSLVAVVEGGRPRLLRDPSGQALLPSVVALDDDGALVV